MLYWQGDFETSVPPYIFTSDVYPNAVKTGTKHWSINVQLAAESARICFGQEKFGKIYIYESPTLGIFSENAEKTDLN